MQLSRQRIKVALRDCVLEKVGSSDIVRTSVHIFHNACISHSHRRRFGSSSKRRSTFQSTQTSRPTHQSQRHLPTHLYLLRSRRRQIRLQRSQPPRSRRSQQSRLANLATAQVQPHLLLARRPTISLRKRHDHHKRGRRNPALDRRKNRDRKRGAPDADLPRRP